MPCFIDLILVLITPYIKSLGMTQWARLKAQISYSIHNHLIKALASFQEEARYIIVLWRVGLVLICWLCMKPVFFLVGDEVGTG